jgi:hypothetical protein
MRADQGSILERLVLGESSRYQEFWWGHYNQQLSLLLRSYMIAMEQEVVI